MSCSLHDRAEKTVTCGKCKTSTSRNYRECVLQKPSATETSSSWALLLREGQ